MFKVSKKDNRHNITRTFVNQYMKYPSFTHERPLNRRHIDELKGEITNGRAHVFQWAICYVDEKNEIYRVDGQHSSNALSDLFKKDQVPTGLVCNLDEYAVETMDEFVKLYNTIDTNVQTRTSTDVMRAAKAMEPKLEPINPTHLHNISRGILFHKNDCKIVKTRIHRETKIKTVISNVKFCLFFNLIYQPRAKFLSRYSVIAAMYAIWKKAGKDDPEAVIDFWNKVRDGDGLKMSDPEKILREMLMSHGSFGRSANPNLKIVSEPDQYAWCINAWNHRRSGRNTKKKFQGVNATGRAPKPRK